jgi:uncharacterized protein with HEPN domain
MPPTLADRLVHILSAIDIIQTLLAKKTLEEFTSDIPLRFSVERASVERAFEVICEASRRLPDNVTAQEKAIDWQRMVDFGNQLRHAYHRINPQTLMEIAARNLPPLKDFAERVIRDSQQ